MNETLAKISIGAAVLAGGGFVYDASIPLADLACVESNPKASIVESIKTEKVRDGLLQYRELSRKEVETIKGCEITKVIPIGRYVADEYGLEIEIQRVEAIDGGLQIFARAWKDGVQLGFGTDGTTDIERFRIFNPPVLVDDPKGDIIIPATFDELAQLPIPERRLREDPIESIKQSLAHTISTTGKTGTKIVVGSVGNTTSTFYAGSGDGSVYRNDGAWSTARDTADGEAAITTDTTRYLMADLDAGVYTVTRNFYPFDTSAIPDTDEISSGTFSIDNTGASSGDRYVGLIQTSQVSNTALAIGDFDAMTINSPSEGASRVLCSTSGYKDFAMNATGIGWISKTSYTKLGTRMAKDIDNVNPGARNYILEYQSEQAGTTNDPKLVVVHAAAAAATAVPQDIFLFE